MAMQLLKESYLDKTTQIKLIPVSGVDIVNITTSFKFKNSSEYDKISNRIIMYYALDIGKPLSNSSLQPDIHPERFKYSVFRHIDKTGSKTKIKFCRPVCFDSQHTSLNTANY
jgi:hypothetical protein